jgi:hypothetical protein
MLGNFLADFCTLDPNLRTRRPDFCARFRAWQEDELGLRRGWSTQYIVAALEAQVNVKVHKSMGVHWFVGVALEIDERNITDVADAVPDDLSSLPETPRCIVTDLEPPRVPVNEPLDDFDGDDGFDDDDGFRDDEEVNADFDDGSGDGEVEL